MEKRIKMKKRKAEEVKKKIMKELFMDINSQKCVLELFLEDSKEFENRKNSLNEYSVAFFSKRKKQLMEEYSRGNILFFRKYSYEKILIEFLENVLRTSNLEMELFFF